MANPLLYDPGYLLNCVPAPSPEQTLLNGSSAKPFYVWGHNPNSSGKIDSDLAAGANALEPDITVAADAPCAGTDVSIADLVMEDSSSPYRSGLCSDTHLVDWLNYVHSKALLADSKLALIAFDIKSSAADAQHVKSILAAIRTYLTHDVPVNVLLSVGSKADAKKAFGDGTEAAWAGIRAADLGTREGVMIDGEDNVLDVYNFFEPIPNNYGNFGYGDGTALNAGDVSFSGVQPRALDHAAFLRASYGFPKIVSYAYLLNAKAEMHSYIDAGVDGIIPGTIASVLPALDSTCQNYYSDKLAVPGQSENYYTNNAKYKLACLLSPITDSGLDVSEITDLVSVVSAHPEIRLATRDDNPLRPKLQSYALEVTTPSNPSVLTGYGTNANIKFTLNGCKGTAESTVNSGFIIPVVYTSGRMEGGQTDYLTIPSADLGTLSSITIYNDGTGVGPDWTFKDLKVSSAGYIGSNQAHNQEYQALGTTTLAAFKSVTLPLTANFSGGGTFSAPSLPDVIAQCSAPLPAAPVATQSCTAGGITGTTDAKGPFGQGDAQIVWTFTDAAKNTKTRTQTVHVHDTIAPVPDAASLPSVVAQCSATLPAPPTATDACSGKITGTTTSPSTFGQGDFTATWKFTDAQSNQSSQNQALMVHDTIPPSIVCSAPLVVNAVGPGGATVPYSVTATDNCAITSLTSAPLSGSLFPIGTTTVNGRATDIALPRANVSTCSFPVHVKGAVEQLQDLLLAVTGLPPGKSLESKVREVLSNVQAGRVANACSGLAAFINEVQAQSGKKLTNVQANSLLVDAARIRAVLGC